MVHSQQQQQHPPTNRIPKKMRQDLAGGPKTSGTMRIPPPPNPLPIPIIRRHQNENDGMWVLQQQQQRETHLPNIIIIIIIGLRMIENEINDGRNTNPELQKEMITNDITNTDIIVLLLLLRGTMIPTPMWTNRIPTTTTTTTTTITMTRTP